MRRLIMIGKWLKGRKSTVIDLQAYRELKRKTRKKGGGNDPVPQGGKKDE